MGQIFQRKYRGADGQVHTCATWTIRYFRNGRAHQEPTKYKRKGDAQNLLKLREGDIVKGLPVTPAAAKVTIDIALADVATDYRINGRKTLRDVELRIRKHLLPALGGRRLSALTTSDVRTFIEARQKAGASNAEINRELAILKRACRLAMQANTLHRAPHIPMLDENNVRKGFFERAEFEAVREALPPHLRPIATFCYVTGWRIKSEVLTLQWRQVDRDAGTVRLEPGTTKNDEGRLFSVCEWPSSSRAPQSQPDLDADQISGFVREHPLLHLLWVRFDLAVLSDVLAL